MWEIPSARAIAAFLGWAISTFLSHFAAKQVFLHFPNFMMLEAALLVSTLQMALGAFIFFLYRSVSSKRIEVDKHSILLGIFQGLGVFLTNYSMSQTSASLTHLVKMSEPICTAFVMAALGKLHFSLHVLFILAFALLTAMGSEPSPLAKSSLAGVGLAILSNISYSLRNTGVKYLGAKEGKEKTTIAGYGAVSLGGTLLMLPIWLLSVSLRTKNYFALGRIFLNEKNLGIYLATASLFHLVYNIISLTVILAVFNPVQHALLNVGKRISVVIALFIFTNKTLSLNNIISAILCLLVTVVGARTLNTSKEKQKSVKVPNKASILKYLLVLFSCGCLYIFVKNNNNQVSDVTITHWESQLLPVSPINFTGGFHIVWSYHEPVTQSALSQINSLAQRVSQDLYVHCGNSECIMQMFSQSAKVKINVNRLNIAEQCSSTPLQPFIQHHAYYKLVMTDFSKTLQKAAILCTLIKYGGFLVNVNLKTPVNLVLPKNSSIVNNENGEIVMASVQKEDYTVYNLMYHMMDQLPMLPYLKDNQLSFTSLAQHNFSFSGTTSNIVKTVPDMIEAELPRTGPQFATFMFDQRVKEAADANAGDEMQGFPGLQFLPRLDVMVDRERMAVYRGAGETVMFGNAWYGSSNIQWPPSNSLRLLLFSLHFGPGFQSKVDTKESIEYLNRAGVSLGSRDEGTLVFLAKLGLITHFSGCATLLLNPSSSNVPDANKKVVIVDVEEAVRDIIIPKKILDKSVVVSQNIESSSVRKDRMARFDYAFSLLNLYGDAKVVVTSRIHAALPCVALGIPVLFVSVPDQQLPGGGGGRTGGLLQLFNVARVNTTSKIVTNEHDCDTPASFCYNWDKPPMNPTPELKERLRASFWNIIRKEPSLKDAAFKFGMIPLKQFNKSEKILKFNLILSTGNLNNLNSRSLESIFWHHPQAQVVVHAKDISIKQDMIDRLAEAGYNIQLQKYDLHNLLSKAINSSQMIGNDVVNTFTDRLPHIINGQYWYSHITDLLRFLIIYLEGGIYIDTDVIIVRPFHALNNSVAFENGLTGTVNGAVMVFEKNNKFVEECLHEYLINYEKNEWGANGPDILRRVRLRGLGNGSSHPHVQVQRQNFFYPIYWNGVKQVCFETNISNANELKQTIEKESFAVHLNNKATKITNKEKIPVSKESTLCRWLLNKFCIFCDELV